MALNSDSWKKYFLHLVFFLCIGASSVLSAQTVVILADTPYTDDEKKMLQGPNGTLFRLINETKPTIVMHLGDLKSGGESCTDELLIEHKTLLDQLYPGKLIYTPGDNDWTDCDRIFLFHSFDELERLNFLTTLLFKTPPLLDKELPLVVSQPAQIENKLWVNDRLAISTLHIVGTSNGRLNIRKSNIKEAIKKVDERDQLNLAWLKHIESRADDFDAIIIGFQADIYQQSVLKSAACDSSSLKACDAFSIYRQAFKDLALKIKKPVLISHGDTGEFCFEQLETNLWHLNAAGDFRYVDATKVTFNKGSAKQPFVINGLINTNLPSIGCNN
jgi:hypothetical protein